MNDFGVIELAGAKTTSAPGWAYVPDTRLPAQQHHQTAAGATTTTTNRKRARNAPGGGLTLSDLTARQENKMRKELEALDRDGGRDATIPLPGKSGRTQGKRTANVRKILQSQKTFANHLDDFLALQALTESNAAAAAAAASKRSGGARNKDASATPGDTPMPDAGRGGEVAADGTQQQQLLAAPRRPPPAAHPGDADPLLVSRVPALPSDAEMRRLLAAPPLSYGEARGAWDPRYPARVFCEVCGYWGRVRCLKCGTRVCALECLETHREECVTRYLYRTASDKSDYDRHNHGPRLIQRRIWGRAMESVDWWEGLAPAEQALMRKVPAHDLVIWKDAVAQTLQLSQADNAQDGSARRRS